MLRNEKVLRGLIIVVVVLLVSGVVYVGSEFFRGVVNWFNNRPVSVTTS